MNQPSSVNCLTIEPHLLGKPITVEEAAEYLARADWGRDEARALALAEGRTIPSVETVEELVKEGKREGEKEIYP